MKNQLEKQEDKYDCWWEGVPEELKYLCIVGVTCNDYSTSGALKYLMDHIDICTSSMSRMNPYDFLKCVNRVFEDCLYPLELHEEDWKNHASDISKILSAAEYFFKRYVPSDYKTGNRDEFDRLRTYNFIEIYQHLDVYKCTLDAIMENWIDLKARINSLIDSTKRNVKYLVRFTDLEEIEDDESIEGYHFPGFDSWQPLNWVCREALSNATWLKHLIPDYEKYVISLYEIIEESEQSDAEKLIYQAEDNLENLCDYAIMYLETDLEDDYGDSYIINDEIKNFKEMVQKSKDRTTALEKNLKHNKKSESDSYEDLMF